MRTQSICLALAIVLLCPLASAQWVQTNGPPGSVSCFAVSGTNLFAGTNAGVFLSTNNGTSWTATGLTTDVLCLAVSGTNLFAGTNSGGFLSTNNGATWTALSGGLPEGSFPIGFGQITSFASSGQNLFAGGWLRRRLSLD